MKREETIYDMGDSDIEAKEGTINQIYNDFKNRTCQNCKLSLSEEETKELFVCDILMSFSKKQASELFNSGWGCNKWMKAA